MLVKIPLKPMSSHYLEDINYRGQSIVKIIGDINKAIINSYDLPGCKLSLINNIDKSLIILQLEIEYNSSLNDETMKIIILQITEYLSFYLSKNDHNPRYGTKYFEIQWIDYNCKKTNVSENLLLPNTMFFSDDISISSSLCMELTTPISIDYFPIASFKFNESLHYFYEGLKTNNNKSKYFHWFLILEHIENSQEYKKSFGSDKLFTNDEINQLKLVPGIDSDERKKSIISELKSRTYKTRTEKLSEILAKRNLANYNIESLKIFIPLIIETRNKLFHSGQPPGLDSLLYDILFPLVCQIIEYDLKTS